MKAIRENLATYARTLHLKSWVLSFVALAALFEARRLHSWLVAKYVVAPAAIARGFTVPNLKRPRVPEGIDISHYVSVLNEFLAFVVVFGLAMISLGLIWMTAAFRRRLLRLWPVVAFLGFLCLLGYAKALERLIDEECASRSRVRELNIDRSDSS